DPLVVHGAFRLFGGRLNDLVMEQGRAAVAVAAGEPILDMPVGTGYFTLEMARHHDGLVVGLDIARGMVEEARERAVAAGVPNLVTVQADSHHLPFPDGTFAAITCSNGLQVIPGLVPSVRELARVLAPGGTLFVSVVLAPVGAALPEATREHLPTLLRPGRDVARELARAGLQTSTSSRARLATLVEATKPF
ncbi:MAG TPA: class I SAM-dependent methyltransferase, partial [Actinomycetota bacterium]|nr:class I SAM-dependent methyltransferase [Actinomycetota bacterium]